MTVDEVEARPGMLVDIEAIEQVYGCELSRVATGRMLLQIARRYRPGIDFESLLETVVDTEVPMTDNERHAYKFVLGKEFWRRKQRNVLSKKTRDRNA